MKAVLAIKIFTPIPLIHQLTSNLVDNSPALHRLRAVRHA